MSRPAGPRLIVLLLLGALCAPPPPAQAASDRPLPEIRAFMEEVRKHLHSDDYLLELYTFTERRTEKRFDAKGNVKEEKHEVYEVYPSARTRDTYRKLVERNGKPLPADELAEQDRDHEKKVARSTKPGEAAEARRRKRMAERERREKELVDALFEVYDIGITGRERLDGRASVVLTFRPRPGVKASNRSGKVLQKFSGRAWVDETDYQVVRAEAELLDTMSYGLGILARLYKGATASFERRKVNGEVWLPAQARFRGRARLLLLKGLRIDSQSSYSDYKKFEVGTDSAIATEKSSE